MAKTKPTKGFIGNSNVRKKPPANPEPPTGQPGEGPGQFIGSVWKAFTTPPGKTLRGGIPMTQPGYPIYTGGGGPYRPPVQQQPYATRQPPPGGRPTGVGGPYPNQGQGPRPFGFQTPVRPLITGGGGPYTTGADRILPAQWWQNFISGFQQGMKPTPIPTPRPTPNSYAGGLPVWQGTAANQFPRLKP